MKPMTEIILDAYREGIFPMAESAQDESFSFYKPYARGLLPIIDLHIPKKLLKTLGCKNYTVTINRAFERIIDGCAAATPKRSNTWINPPIRSLFVGLHQSGHAHSVEVWRLDGTLMGGLYGLGIGKVFCGESMVSFERDGSKIALVYLCALLWKAGYSVLDTQFINPHLLQFGAYEIPQEDYEVLIKREMEYKVLDITSIPSDRTLLSSYLAMKEVRREA